MTGLCSCLFSLINEMSKIKSKSRNLSSTSSDMKSDCAYDLIINYCKHTKNQMFLESHKSNSMGNKLS